jgi:hypothetical protein
LSEKVVQLKPGETGPPSLCVGDKRPCYVGRWTDDAHWRCGTSQCGSDYLAGRASLSKTKEADHG